MKKKKLFLFIFSERNWFKKRVEKTKTVFRSYFQEKTGGKKKRGDSKKNFFAQIFRKKLVRKKKPDFEKSQTFFEFPGKKGGGRVAHNHKIAP